MPSAVFPSKKSPWAIPHKDCATDASSNFSSDETKSGVNTGCIHVKYDGKFASRWRAKSPDALCAVLPKDNTHRMVSVFRKTHAVCLLCIGGMPSVAFPSKKALDKCGILAYNKSKERAYQ